MAIGSCNKILDTFGTLVYFLGKNPLYEWHWNFLINKWWKSAQKKKNTTSNCSHIFQAFKKAIKFWLMAIGYCWPKLRRDSSYIVGLILFPHSLFEQFRSPNMFDNSPEHLIMPPAYYETRTPFLKCLANGGETKLSNLHKL